MTSTTNTLIVDRTPPRELIDLTELALELGFDKVSLNHGGDSDEPAPTGWNLFLVRRDPEMFWNGDDAERNQPAADLQRIWVRARIVRSGDGVVTKPVEAYVANTKLYCPDAIDENHLTVEEIKTWMRRTDIDAVGEFQYPHPPVFAPGTPESAILAADLQIFTEALARGWDCERTLLRHQQSSLARTFDSINQKKGTSHKLSTADLPMPARFRFSWLNWHYNDEGHPGFRGSSKANGGHDDPDIESSDDIYAHRSDAYRPDSWRQDLNVVGQMSGDEALAAIAQPAPWSEPVAYMQEPADPETDEFGEWVL